MEKVLCLPTPVAHETLVAGKQYILSDIREILNKFGTLIPKDLAEHQPQYQQIIPYIAVYNPITEVFLVYRRPKTEGEKRLHGKWAFVGGHINMTDCLDNRPLTKAAIREIAEETQLSNSLRYRFCSHGTILIETETEVGLVHTGVLMLAITPEHPYHRESEVYKFVSLSDLQKMAQDDDTERWLKLASSYLPDLIATARNSLLGERDRSNRELGRNGSNNPHQPE